MRRVGIWAVFFSVAVASSADTITVGGNVYHDVYVGTDKHYYFVHFPDEGRIEKISRKRADVSGFQLDADPAAREALLMRYRENKDTSAVAPAARADAPAKMRSHDLKMHARIESAALFDAQVAYWSSLTDQQRHLLRERLHKQLEFDQIENNASLGIVKNQAEELKSRQAHVEKRISALDDERQHAHTNADAFNRADNYKKRYVKSVAEAQLGERPTPNDSYRRKAIVEEAKANAVKSLARREFEQAAAPHKKQLNALESAMRQKERDAVAEERKTADNAKRIASFQTRIAQLDEALAQGYLPQLNAHTVASWKDSASQTSEPFSIDAPLWRLDCLRDDFAFSGSFSITIYDAETDRPFTRISDADFLQMRVRVLDGPGRYYLEIEQDESGSPYAIYAVTFESLETSRK